mmetsp:Transcript_20620/g.66148  ORF Transcript_20620/g.66148 Transcript_20620/m.66148 type:complete len:250 (-) Transcript_20620:749-1498(-)
MQITGVREDLMMERSSATPPLSALPAMPSTSSITTTRFLRPPPLPPAPKSSTWMPTTAATRLCSELLFRVSEAFSSYTSYPRLAATSTAADDLPTPGGPLSSAALAPGLVRLKGTLSVFLMCTCSHCCSHLVSPRIWAALPTNSPGCFGLCFSVHSMLLSSLVRFSGPSVAATAAAAAALRSATLASYCSCCLAAVLSYAARSCADSESSTSARSLSSSMMDTPFVMAERYLLLVLTSRPSSSLEPATR